MRAGFGVPWCNICGKSVDKISMQKDPMNDKYRIVAECHGESEVREFYEEGLISSFDEAFSNPKFFGLKGRDFIHKVRQKVNVD